MLTSKRLTETDVTMTSRRQNDVKTSKSSYWRHARESSYTPYIRRQFLAPVGFTEIPVGYAGKICQHWWKSLETLSGMQEYKILSWVEVRIEKSVRVSLIGVTKLRRVMPNSDPEGRIFLSAPNSHYRYFFLHTFWSPAFDFNVGVAINESCCLIFVFLSTPRVR